MGFTISSPTTTLSIAGLVATYAANSHGIGGLLYVKYTKGDEDGVTISLTYKSKALTSTDLYQHVSLNATTRVLSATTYNLTLSGNYRIPITWTCEEVALIFTFAQYGVTTATGTLYVDFREAD
jgi:hypothetical protein